MQVEKFVQILGADYYTGVPDSQLKALCDYLMQLYGINSKHHMIAANEGNAVALAAGYHMATGKTPVVYMQNSGEGNAVNPIASLTNEAVYAIPMIFVIGWRGEPGVPDEPQHIFQGEVTLSLLDLLGIPYFVLDKETADIELSEQMGKFQKVLDIGRSVAVVIRKGGLQYDMNVDYYNENIMVREEVIKHIVSASGNNLIVSTTGKASRELYEIRDENGQEHSTDFLTVGSMGHCSSIALGIACQKTDKKIWCIDGDGAALMHLGAMTTIGSVSPKNLIHIVINNGAHETVGGMPTTASKINFHVIAKSCGYSYAVCVNDYYELDYELNKASTREELTFIEVRCGIGSRKDLGRPKTKAIDNKREFMNRLLNY